jgi:ornithine carbamoyltransferase
MTSLASRSPTRLLGIDDLDGRDLDALLDLAALMRRHPLAWRGALEGRAIACLFEPSSTRGRVSLEVAVNRLGALPVSVPATTSGHAARAPSAYCDAIAMRTGRHRDLLELAEHASVPVLNAGSDRETPCRALADCLALRDRYGTLRGLQVACVAGQRPDPALLAHAGRAVEVFDSPRETVIGAAAVYAAEAATTSPDLLGYAASGAIPMHASTSEQRLNLLGVQQALLRGIVTGG